MECFSYGWNRVMGLGEITEVNCHCHQITAGVHTINMIIADLDNLVEVVFARFPHCRVALFTPFLLKETTLTYGVGSYVLPPSEGRHSFGIILYGRFVSSLQFIYFSIIYLYPYGLGELYFILWVLL